MRRDVKIHYGTSLPGPALEAWAMAQRLEREWVLDQAVRNVWCGENWHPQTVRENMRCAPYIAPYRLRAIRAEFARLWAER